MKKSSRDDALQVVLSSQKIGEHDSSTSHLLVYLWVSLPYKVRVRAHLQKRNTI
jgi:hypothetical protein